MKFNFFLLILLCFQINAKAYSQTNITLKVTNASIKKVVVAIEKKGDYRFVYDESLLKNQQLVTIDVTEQPIEKVLNQVLEKSNIDYKIMSNNLVILKVKEFVNTTSKTTQIKVSGTVLNSLGSPLSGVSVSEKGSTNGTSTDASGSYSISVADGATLSFSYVGYTTVEEKVNGRTTITVVLTQANNSLEEVVVVGYGTQKKKDVTGAVASIAGADIANQAVQTATQAIQGKVAGVQIITSGEPNSLPTVRLRGTGSVLAGANPLYVVDGLLTDDIRNINNADILTMDILKDASSTAIYGVRGANGVIIITTKKGRSGKTKVEYNGTVGLREATNLVDMAGEKQYAGYLNEANIFYGSGTELVPAASLQGNNTDWYDAILRRSVQTSHNISLSGGSDKFLFFLSGGYLNDEGILLKNKYNRYTVRSNNEYTINKKLKLTSQLSYTNGTANGAQFGAFSDAYRASPTVASKIGNKFGNTSLLGNVSNPLVTIDKAFNEVIGNKIQGSFGIDLKPIQYLTLRTAVNFDLDYTRGTTYGYKFLSDTSTFLTAGGNQGRPVSDLNVFKQNNSILIWDNTATYDRSFDKHKVTLLAGYVAEKDEFNVLTGTANDVAPARNQWYLSSVSNGSQNVTNAGDKRTRISYLGRVNYGYDNRYLITGTLRADGSSKFGKNQRYGYFPAVAVGWNLTNESFMENQKTFDNLKVRASYGKKGNDNIASSAFVAIAQQGLPYYFPSGGSPTPGIAFTDIVDENVHWENTTELDLGFDFSTLGRRLTGTFDYYDKKTSDALINIGLPSSSGDTRYLTNATTITNKGAELALNWQDKIGKDVKYGIGGTIAHNKNKIEKLNGGQPIPGATVGKYQPTLTNNGYAIASYYVLQMDGIFQNQKQIDSSAQKNARAGDIRYKDLNKDGVINDDDRDYSGSYQPKLTYGLNGNAAYKGFDVNFSAYGTAGAKIYNGKKAARGSQQQTDNIEANVAKNRWTPNNPSNKVPRATLQDLPASTYFIEKGDFLRLNNVTLGYTLSNSRLPKIKLSSLRLYIAAQNLFTITNYSGFSPEFQNNDVTNSGIDINAYPTTRSYVVGLNIGF